MHDFFCVDADEILNPLLKEGVKYLKETEGGRAKSIFKKKWNADKTIKDERNE